MILITLLVGFCFLSALITLALGFFVFARDPASRVHRLFLAAMLGTTYWALGEFFIWNAGTAEGVWFWLKASSFWPIVIVITVHFILALTEHPLARPGKPHYLVDGLYVLGIVFSLVGLFTDLTHRIVPRSDGSGFGYMALSTSPAYIAESLFIIIIIAGAVAAGVSAWRSAHDRRKKKQVKYVCIGISATVVFGALSGIILPLIGIYIPNSVFIGIVVFSLCITYAITRYGLFTLDPETALPCILQTMPDGVILMGMDGRISTANAAAARIFGTEEKDLAGQQAVIFLPERTYRSIMAAIQEHGSFADLEAETGSRQTMVVSIAGSLVRDPLGEPAGIVLIIRDISNRKRQQHALQAANEKISLISRLTSHDINNLVTGLSGYLLLLEDNNTKPPEDGYLRTSIELVDKIGQNLRFSSDFLHLGTFEPGWQSLMGLVAEAENTLPHKNVAITVQVPAVEIYADPLSVKAFYNILENALHHGEKLTTVAITAQEQENNELVVVIEDNGGGVPDGEKERIFQYGIGKHTGLGLSFARTILEVTGITIRETGVPGTGARFEIRVPAHAWRPASPPAWEAEK